MSKYSPLRDYLQKQTLRELDLSFREIENILGDRLPKSADRPQWWANVKQQTSHVQREAWRKAGYDAFLISGASKVKFRKTS